MILGVKKKCMFVLCLLLAVIFMVMYSSLVINRYIFVIVEDKSTKYILYWTPMFQNKAFNLGLGSDIFANCTYKNCYATHNRSLVPVEQFSAILFHGVEYSVRTYGKPATRTPNQVYVYSNQESPLNTPAHWIGETNGFYNWTMSYRLDSDIPRTYGYVIKQPTTYQLPSLEEINQKQNRIAWFVSNCDTSSRRRQLAQKINKYIPVDIYGSCGKFSCPKSKEHECYEMMEKKYKFYFSAENSICLDYATEKLFNVMKKNVIPLVYGGAQYEKITPMNSVIDVTNFENVESLTRYLNFLDKHPKEYRKYFEWKKDNIVDTSSEVTLCSLCEKLHQPLETKIYEDIHGWWAGEKNSMCDTGNNLPNIILNLKDTND